MTNTDTISITNEKLDDNTMLEYIRQNPATIYVYDIKKREIKITGNAIL